MKTKKAIPFAVAGALVLVAAISSVKVVPAGHTGVVLTLGKVSDHVLQEGFHLKVPFVQSVEIMSNKIQVYEATATAVSKDLQSVSSAIAVNYKIGNESSANIYQKRDLIIRRGLTRLIKTGH